MTVIPVSALECSITELCRILADSFNESLTPFALPPEMPHVSFPKDSALKTRLSGWSMITRRQ